MLTIQDFDAVLIEYKRDLKGNYKGVVVAIGPDIIGWSLCNPKDTFEKRVGLSLALGRAIKAALMPLTDTKRLAFYETCPFTLNDIFDRMTVRSVAYFQQDED